MHAGPDVPGTLKPLAGLTRATQNMKWRLPPPVYRSKSTTYPVLSGRGSECTGRRRVLALYVLAENRNRRAAHGPHKIAWRPQVTLALADPPERRDSREFLLHAPRRDAFEAVHQLGQAHLRRIVDQQVYVVGFAVEFLQHRFEVGADRSEISSRRL